MRLILTTRAIRAFADGLILVILPWHLERLGFSVFEIGVWITLTLLGSAAFTLATGLYASRAGSVILLQVFAVIMALTGLAMAGLSGFWPLALIGFLGTLNPSGGDVTAFMPLEHVLLTKAGPEDQRTKRFGLYSLIGSLAGAAGSGSAALIGPIAQGAMISTDEVLRLCFGFYGLVALIALCLYRLIPQDKTLRGPAPVIPRNISRPILILSALFSLDSFAGGFLIQSFILIWLHQTFGVSTATLGPLFMGLGILGALSQPLAARLSGWIGLVNTMAYTHIPAGLCAMALPFAPDLNWAIGLLVIRAAFQQMDVPARASFVMAIAGPDHGAAAAGLTNVPRSLASAAAPILVGWMMTALPPALPFAIGGALKVAYDICLLILFRRTHAQHR